MSTRATLADFARSSLPANLDCQSADYSPKRSKRSSKEDGHESPQSAASLRSAGLVVILDAPRANTYAAMDAVRGMDDIVNNVGDSPDRRIVQRIKDAFRRGRPLLLVVLGPRK